MVLGEVGVGKSTLVAELINKVAAGRFTICRANGSPTGSSEAFATIRDLFGDLDRAALGSASEAGVENAVADLETTEAASIPSAGLALLARVSLLASLRPILIVVDDAQWVDGSSLATLTFVARRLLTDSALVVLASRPTDGATAVDGPHKSGAAPFDTRGLTSIELTRLSIDEAAGVLRSAGMPPGDARRLAVMSGGLPSVLEGLVARAISSESNASPQLALPDRVLDVVRNLPADVFELALYVALEPEYRVLEQLFGSTTRPRLDAAERAGVVLALRDRVDFRDPLFRVAVLDLADGLTVRHAHRRIASVLNPSDDADRRAFHLGEAADGFDDEAASCLTGFAVRARIRGAHDDAAKAFRRASELTADAALRSRRLLESGRTSYFAGRTQSVIDVAEEVCRTASDPEVRFEAQTLHAHASVWGRNPEAVSAELTAAANGSADQQREPGERALLSALSLAFLSNDVARSIPLGLRARHLTPEADVSGRLLVSEAASWNAFLLVANRDPVVIDDPVGVALPSLLAQRPIDAEAFCLNRALRLMMTERFADADALIAWMLPELRGLGMRSSGALISLVSAELRWRQGSWEEAALQSQSVLDNDDLPPLARAWAHAVVAQLSSSMGRSDETEAHVRTALAFDIVAGSALVRSTAHAALGHLRLSEGHYAQAVENFELVDEALRSAGINQPEFLLWQGDFVESLVGTGDVVGALRVVADLEKHQDLAWCRAVVARTTGLLCDDVADAERFFEVALAEFASVPFPFEVARTHLARGSTQARAGVESERALSKARRMFAALGAATWAAAAGSRTSSACSPGAGDVIEPKSEPRRVPGPLTAAEFRTAAAAASGRSNTDIAEELCLSIRTVEFHLASVYRKLGVKNRAMLAALMNDGMQSL